MKPTKYHGHRALLNLPGHESTAAIVAEIEDTSGWKRGKDREGDELRWNPHPVATLQFANCDRSIAFEVDVSPEGRDNSYYKVDMMISALQQFRDGLRVEAAEYDKRKAALKRKGVTA